MSLMIRRSPRSPRRASPSVITTREAAQKVSAENKQGFSGDHRDTDPLLDPKHECERGHKDDHDPTESRLHGVRKEPHVGPREKPVGSSWRRVDVAEVMDQTRGP